MLLPDYRPHFPFPTIRDEQKRTIEFILDAFLNQGKRYVVCQCGTGVGKSAIGVTVARVLAEHGGKTFEPASNTVVDVGEPVETTGAYVLTTQKLLQQQYIDDFGPTSGHAQFMRSLKSASNYECRFYSDQTCAESRRLLSQLGKQLEGTEFHKCCRGSCPYTLDKQEFMDAPLGITNFSYFLAETMYAKQLTPRSLLVIDEAHVAETELGKFIEVVFSEHFARTVLGCRVPKLETDDAVIAWVKGPYKRSIQKVMKSIEQKLGVHLGTAGISNNSGLAELSKKYELLDKHVCKVNRFISTYDPSNWVMNVVVPIDGNKRKGRKFEFKPVDVSRFGHEYLYRFGSRVLLMSATIVDYDSFCRSVGIDQRQSVYFELPSPFPVGNRPVHYLGVGSMSLKNIDDTLPKLVETIKALLELHKNDKGIIHAVSFKVAQYIVDNVKSPRLLIHDSSNREDTVNRHLDSSEPTVLISPSMMEGIDLADDASRFQILCKIPYPYLGDQVTKLRMKRDPKWYSMMTARSIIQALGRSVRNEHDHATSYILDADWVRFYRDNKPLFPKEFSLALT